MELCRIAAHRCCCRAWPAFVFELRTEQVSIVRAAILGDNTVDAAGLGLYRLPHHGGQASGSKVVVPLVRRNSAGGAAESVTGMLHLHVSLPHGRPCGEGSVIISVRGATNLSEGELASSAIVVVRVIGFERTEDANLHMEAWRAGYPEPIPRGRAYVQRTTPGKSLKNTIVWEDTFEFLGLGDVGAAAAHTQLQGAIPSRIGLKKASTVEELDMERMRLSPCMENDSSEAQLPDIGEAGSISSGSALDLAVDTPFTERQRGSVLSDVPRQSSPWSELLPPTVGISTQLESAARCFCAQTAPWAEEGSTCPPHWL